jgi:Bacterial conjugation TrbI-like protein
MYESSISSYKPLNLVDSSEESSDWELQMAKLVGLEEHPPTKIEKLPAIDVEEVQESIPAASSQPQEQQTSQSLSSNPFAKLALVSAGTLGIVLVAGVFLSQLMNVGNQKTNNTASLPVQPPPTNQPRPQLESEVETLKTKLALTEQAEALKTAQQKLRSQVIASQPSPARTQASTSDNVTPRRDYRIRVPSPRVTAPAQIAYIPRPINTIPNIPPKTIPLPSPRILQSPQPAVKPTLSPLPAKVQPTTQPVVRATAQPTPDPLQEWTKLAKLGSYGLVTVASNRGDNSNNSKPASTPTAPQATNPQPTQTPPPQPQPPAVNPSQPQSPKSVAVGTSAKAVLATAVFGETTRSSSNDKNEDNKTVFVVRLKQPLKSVDNAIALPEKTELLAEIRSISEQGLLQLNVVKVILPNNNNPIEKSLPPNAMIIRGTKGKPLIANQYPNRGGSIAWMDAGLFVLGGLGKAAELSNRTESQVVTTNAGGTIISNSNPRRNVLAGVLEGGMTTIVPQIAQRNQQAISQLSQRTNVWFLPAGKELEVYVNQSMQF